MVFSTDECRSMSEASGLALGALGLSVPDAREQCLSAAAAGGGEPQRLRGESLESDRM